jgi:hypothetical protein
MGNILTNLEWEPDASLPEENETFNEEVLRESEPAPSPSPITSDDPLIVDNVVAESSSENRRIEAYPPSIQIAREPRDSLLGPIPPSYLQCITLPSPVTLNFNEQSIKRKFNIPVTICYDKILPEYANGYPSFAKTSFNMLRFLGKKMKSLKVIKSSKEGLQELYDLEALRQANKVSLISPNADYHQKTIFTIHIYMSFSYKKLGLVECYPYVRESSKVLEALCKIEQVSKKVFDLYYNNKSLLDRFEQVRDDFISVMFNVTDIVPILNEVITLCGEVCDSVEIVNKCKNKLKGIPAELLSNSVNLNYKYNVTHCTLSRNF